MRFELVELYLEKSLLLETCLSNDKGTNEHNQQGCR